MVTVPDGSQVATVQVSIGGSAPFTAEIDTGSVGLRVVTGTVPDAYWQIGNQTATVVYGSGVVAYGSVANATVTIGGLATNWPINMVDITDVWCSATKPNCYATEFDNPADFRFSNVFPAILGVGMRSNAVISSPIEAIGESGQYVLSLPALDDTAGHITIDPGPGAVARFDTSIQLSPAATGTGFDDTGVWFCVNALCKQGILDTGQPDMVLVPASPADYAALGVPANAQLVRAGTDVQVTIASTATATNATWSFQVGQPPTAGLDRIDLEPHALVNNLGITPFHTFDMLYDYGAGTIGIGPKHP